MTFKDIVKDAKIQAKRIVQDRRARINEKKETKKKDKERGREE